DHAKWQRHVIDRDDQVPRVALSVMRKQRAHSVAAQIHEGLRPGQHHSLAGYSDFGNICARFVAEAIPSGALEQPVNEHEPEVMAGRFILPARIPESNYEPHNSAVVSCQWPVVSKSSCQFLVESSG